MWLVQYKQLLYNRQNVVTEILLKVVLNTITITPQSKIKFKMLRRGVLDTTLCDKV